MSKALAQQLGNFIGSSIQYDTKAIVDEVRDYMRIRVKLDARVLLRRLDEGFCPIRAIEGKKKLVMKSSVFLMAASRRAKGARSCWLCDEMERQVPNIMRLILLSLIL
ncbi:hypothetical protein Golob_008143 [Gossypium lobatum]|uniref:Uncharacterized protein n=1 Tax=Gossypium lobatum TaxID=34289 RepID=A0A7J8MEL8_9ROSI|nr:hypothetical protein [Gossypium lobatum]